MSVGSYSPPQGAPAPNTLLLRSAFLCLRSALLCSALLLRNAFLHRRKALCSAFLRLKQLELPLLVSSFPPLLPLPILPSLLLFQLQSFLASVLLFPALSRRFLLCSHRFVPR